MRARSAAQEMMIRARTYPEMESFTSILSEGIRSLFPSRSAILRETRILSIAWRTAILPDAPARNCSIVSVEAPMNCWLSFKKGYFARSFNSRETRIQSASIRGARRYSTWPFPFAI